MSRRAVVLAGGRGSRLRPYTVVLPKPLMPIGDYPILEVIIRQLAHCGFDHITLAVNHQAEIVRAFFQDGSKWGIHIDYSLELQPLSTIAPLKLITDLPEHFLLMNGDVLTDLDFGAFYNQHVDNERLFTVSAARRRHVIDYGVLSVGELGQLTAFLEKPTHDYLVSMGVYAVSRKCLGGVPSDRKYGFDDLMIDMLSSGLPVHVEPYSGEWLDIGRPDDYLQAIDIFEQNRERFLTGSASGLATTL